MISYFETYLKLSGYDISHATQKLNLIQSLSPEEFRKCQDNKKWDIASYHYENNPFYRKKVGNNFPSKWDDLPIMEKSDFQNDLEKLFSKGYNRKNTYFANTSGSSGQPLYFAKDKEAHAMDWALIKDRYSWHGLKLNSKQARFYGIPHEKWSYRKEKVKDLLMNRIRFSVFDLSDNILQEYLIKFKHIKFQFIYGYTNSIVMFARYLIRKKIVLNNICQTLKCCITTSEVLTIEDRELLLRAFGVKVVNEYGVSEAGQMAIENNQGDWLLADEISNIELIEDESGKINGTDYGRIVITDLDNKAMPFIRYNIGDLGIISKELSENGKNRKLEKLLGRENDNIYLPSGKVSPGFTLYYVSRSILESTGVLKEYIIRQTKLDEFIFEVVTNEPLTEYQENDIKKKVEIYLEPGLNLVINRVEKIVRPPSGKIKHFHSEIS